MGFYLVRDGELQLGPFQGPVACYTIGKGRGVCGTAWEQAQTILVPDVEQFAGHIACSSRSRSEIVVPIFKDGQVAAVIDVDSESLNASTLSTVRPLNNWHASACRLSNPHGATVSPCCLAHVAIGVVYKKCQDCKTETQVFL